MPRKEKYPIKLTGGRTAKATRQARRKAERERAMASATAKLGSRRKAKNLRSAVRDATKVYLRGQR